MKLPSIPSALSPYLSLLKIVAVAGLVFAGYHYLVSAPRHAVQTAATANASTVEANAMTAAAVDTVRTIETYHNTTERVETRTRETNGNITSAPGAQAPISDSVYAAFVGALCLHDDRADDVCRERAMLHADDPNGQPPEAGPSRADPR